jgi:membrane-associated phospholipid phosphatase
VTHIADRLSLLAVVSFGIFVVLAIAVARKRFAGLDRAGAHARGVGSALAMMFTISGRNYALTALAIVAWIACAAAHVAWWIPLTICVSQVLSQAVVEGCKQLVRRTRPDDWLLHHEAGFSYPSGHAATSVTFYGAWAIVLLASSAPEGAKRVGVIALGIWMLGIMWSRLALAAHYVTDVIGGALFGCAWMCCVLLLVLHLSGML